MNVTTILAMIVQHSAWKPCILIANACMHNLSAMVQGFGFRVSGSGLASTSFNGSGFSFWISA